MVGTQITMAAGYVAGSNIFNGERNYFVTVEGNNPANRPCIAQFGKAPAHRFWEMNAGNKTRQQGW